MNLNRSIRAEAFKSIAFVGAGGKTTAMFQLAHQLTAPVIVTATSHLAKDQLRLADQHLFFRHIDDLDNLLCNKSNRVILITGEFGPDDRTQGLEEPEMEAVRNFAHQKGCHLLIEADGSRRLPLKAPADHEPPIPVWVDCVVNVAGLSGLGKPLDAQHVHRHALFGSLAGIDTGQQVTWAGLTRVLTSELGGLKNIPVQAKKVLLLNQADTADMVEEASRASEDILPFYDAVIIGALQEPSEKRIARVFERTVGVILAAGGSLRLGQPKAMLGWQGKSFIRTVVETAAGCGLTPIIVVLGAVEEPIRKELDGLPVQFVMNYDWQAGQGGSVALAVSNMPRFTGGALFLLADQPHAPGALINGLIDQHRQSMSQIIIPVVGDRRANPVYFDADTFQDLRNLHGETGGRSIFSKFSLDFFPWDDARILLDVDTPNDYETLLNAYGE